MAKVKATSNTALVWFRQDLRLADNPALVAGIRAGNVIPVYILDDNAAGDWKMGGASRWWLHKSLEPLSRDLETRGSRLILRRGNAADILPDLIEQTAATHVFWNRQYEPWAISRDTALKSKLKTLGIATESSNASLLIEPWDIRTGSGGPFKVFTPFWKAALSAINVQPQIAAPSRIPSPARWPTSESLKDWSLLPTRPNWAAPFSEHWHPGEQGAEDRLTTFVRSAMSSYVEGRDRPDQPLTSRLSPHLHFGELSPHRVWHAAKSAAQAFQSERSADKFLAEIGWREFSYHLLYAFPDLPSKNFRPDFDRFPWLDDERAFKAWTRGLTGYPIVDAGMRELWSTGYMHNRVRMVAASFLVKHLLVHWRKGEAWFWDTLLDADLASNAASWQWVAGSGADAAPYFRIFNPMLQGERFDPDGKYVRHWIPELKTCEPEHIHQPWRSPRFTSFRYPAPIVDHAHARARALESYKAVKQDDQTN